ncbi:hypothetical protein CC86DRAFT_365421 [Ophiobolus disseminans]|uniref:Uncharacterized protein n=1 Tax=Ophiobolus disseminans TaxID=1469910 RepID=A0A6A7AKP0_9PLEO|nr:hypothetical protein CC86DRAFT_365421 [Ophiobolus disseminans]
MPFAANYEEFLTSQAQNEYPPPPEMLSAFRKLFTETSTPMSAIAKEAATPIIAAIPNETEPSNPDCGYLWRILKDAVDQFPKDTDKFADFVVELQMLPDGDHVFKYLPQFRHHWTEFGFTINDWPSDEEDRDALRQAQTNQHSFLAKLSTHKQVESDQIGRAGFTLRSTCEFAEWEKLHFPDIEEWYDPEDEEDWPATRDRELELVSIKILNAKIPAAAQWIQITGQRLFEMEGELEGEYDWQEEALNVKWKGGKGWSKERFAFWRERFELYSTATALEKSTQRIAKDCAERMKKIEEGK